MYLTFNEWVKLATDDTAMTNFDFYDEFFTGGASFKATYKTLKYQYGNCIVNFDVELSNDKITLSDIEELHDIIRIFFESYRYKYTHLKDSENFTYNPIENYRMTEQGEDIRTPDITNATTYNNTLTRTAGQTQTHTRYLKDEITPNTTETRTPTQEIKTETKTLPEPTTKETKTLPLMNTTETTTLPEKVTNTTLSKADENITETTKPVVKVETTTSTTDQVSAFDTNTFANDRKSDTTQTVNPILGGANHDKGDTKETVKTYENTEQSEMTETFLTGKNKEIKDTVNTFVTGKDKEITQTDVSFAQGKNKEILTTDISFVTGRDKETISRTGKETTDYTGYETTAGTGADTDNKTGTDSERTTGTETTEHTLTRSGNIGVTTSQQMIESERAVANFSALQTFVRDLATYIFIAFK